MPIERGLRNQYSTVPDRPQTGDFAAGSPNPPIQELKIPLSRVYSGDRGVVLPPTVTVCRLFNNSLTDRAVCC